MSYDMTLRPKVKRRPGSGVEDQHTHPIHITQRLTCKCQSKYPPIHLDHRLLSPTRLKNSFLVFSLFSMQPSTQLVIVVALVFSTPRITIHRWLDSITTATPCGFRTSMTAWATSLVRRSWIWRRRENMSAIRGSFEIPITSLSGM
jgi:hypothetical protein